MTTMADCPKCDPLHPELDEDGRPYACYFCGDSGAVPQAVADAYWQDLTDAAEYPRLAPVVDGKHVHWRCDGYDSWQVSMPLLPVSVFPHRWSPQAGMFLLSMPTPGQDVGFEDIPF